VRSQRSGRFGAYEVVIFFQNGGDSRNMIVLLVYLLHETSELDIERFDLLFKLYMKLNRQWRLGLGYANPLLMKTRREFAKGAVSVWSAI
jgi:hypothetical protein